MSAPSHDGQLLVMPARSHTTGASPIPPLDPLGPLAAEQLRGRLHVESTPERKIASAYRYGTPGELGSKWLRLTRTLC